MRRGERADEEQALERDVDDAGALGQRAAERRQHVGHGDAHHRGDERRATSESVAIMRAPRRAASRRRTAGAAAATAKMITACSTSTISLGTSALTASAPCDSVPKSSAAATTPSGRARPSTATAMPM